MDTAISENVSKKQGRPKMFSSSELALARSLNPEVATEHQRQNVLYRQVAICVIDDDEQCRWLWDRASIMRGDGKMKATILSEPGRIRDHNLLLTTARLVSKTRWPTRRAVAAIRRVRGVRQELGSDADLVRAICSSINQYVDSHLDLADGWDTIFSALDTVRAMFEDTRHQRTERNQQ